MKLTEIPKGDYCYKFNGKNGTHDDGLPYMGIDTCPYSDIKEINGVEVDWCTYLNSGGLGNNTTDEEWEKLVEHFGSEGVAYDGLPLDLLFDGCKHCGVNCDDEE